MRLENYLIIEGNNQSLSDKKALEMVRSECSQAWESKTKLYRGHHSTLDNLFYDSRGIVRTSPYAKNNLYNILLSNLPSWKRYPKRNESVICSFAEDKAYGYNEGFYFVYPYDGLDVGICSGRDLWDSFRDVDPLNKLNRVMENVLDFMHEINEFDDYSDTKKFFARFDKWIDDPDNFEKFNQESYEEPYDFFKKIGYFEWRSPRYLRLGKLIDVLNNVLDPKYNGFKLVKAGKYPPGCDTEAWFSGPCILMIVNPALHGAGGPRAEG